MASNLVMYMDGTWMDKLGLVPYRNVPGSHLKCMEDIEKKWDIVWHIYRHVPMKERGSKVYNTCEICIFLLENIKLR